MSTRLFYPEKNGKRENRGVPRSSLSRKEKETAGSNTSAKPAVYERKSRKGD